MESILINQMILYFRVARMIIQLIYRKMANAKFNNKCS